MIASTVVALLGLAASGSAHMTMKYPVPFGLSTLNNSPLDASGSDFPCKQRPNVYAPEGASNTAAIGGPITVSFTGTAVHGGGSCQFSISYEENPGADPETWKVIHSVEGGCPVKGNVPGNLDGGGEPDSYTFTIPEGLAPGKVVFAWSWWNRIGNREMYMNCAPLTLTGGSGNARRSARLQERQNDFYSSLPNMFRANIGGGCSTLENFDLQFPDPGEFTDLDFGAAAKKGPNGSCGSVKSYGGPSAGNKGPVDIPDIPVVANAQIPDVNNAQIPATSSAVPEPIGTGIPPPPQGGVFKEIPADVEEKETLETPEPPARLAVTTKVDGAQSGACTDEGVYNCIDGKSFQRCASGTWSVVQQMAAGTKCAVGTSAEFEVTAERKLRFSR